VCGGLPGLPAQAGAAGGVTRGGSREGKAGGPEGRRRRRPAGVPPVPEPCALNALARFRAPRHVKG